MKKLTLIVLGISAIAAFGFSSTNSPNNNKVVTLKENVRPLKGDEKSGFVMSNQDSW